MLIGGITTLLCQSWANKPLGVAVRNPVGKQNATCGIPLSVAPIFTNTITRYQVLHIRTWSKDVGWVAFQLRRLFAPLVANSMVASSVQPLRCRSPAHWPHSADKGSAQRWRGGKARLSAEGSGRLSGYISIIVRLYCSTLRWQKIMK